MNSNVLSCLINNTGRYKWALGSLCSYYSSQTRQRRSDMVDLCLLKLLRSSLIDFHISTNPLGFYWEGSHFSDQDSKLVPVITKAQEAFIVQYPRASSDDPLIDISNGQPCPTFSGHTQRYTKLQLLWVWLPFRFTSSVCFSIYYHPACAHLAKRYAVL